MLPSVVVLLATAWAPSSRLAARSRGSTLRCHACVLTAAEQKLGPGRWEGDATRRPLGQMERLLNARRSWSGAMTTAHVSAALIDGPPPTEAELLAGLAWVLQRHPMLAACVRKSKFHVPDAKEYPLHSDYLGKAVEYTKELLRTYPDDDIQRFEPSPLTPDALARRALSVVHVETPLDETVARRVHGGDGRSRGGGGGRRALWRLTLYTSAAEPSRSALVYAANHAVSDQRSFHLVLSETLDRCAAMRAGGASEEGEQPTKLPLPPSVEGALLGTEQRQSEEIKERLELLIGRFGDAWGPEVGGRRWLPSWEAGRARLSTIKYALWQMGASGMRVLPRWVPEGDAVDGRWTSSRRRTRATFRELSAEETTAPRAACKARGTTIGAALCAAAALGASDAMGTLEEGEGGDGAPRTQRYKLLQALDMRTLNFGEGGADQPGARDDWSGGTVLAGTGSLDMLVDLPPGAGEALRASGDLSALWACAKECGQQTRDWIASGWARESLLLFSAGWEFMNMNRVVELGAQDRATLGRAFSAGLSNAGVFGHRCSYGDLTLSSVFFGISQTVSAPAISASAVTVDGRMCLTVQYASPIWPEAEAEAFADDLLATLKLASKPGS